MACATRPLIVTDGFEFYGTVVRRILTHFINDGGGDLEPGSPWENGYVESFNGKLRDEISSDTPN